MIEYTLAQLQALHDIANKTDLYFFRKVCRWYSHQFHTPLHQVETLPWFEVLQHYYEHYYEQLNNNDLLEVITESVPELREAKEKDDEAFIAEIMKQNEENAKKQQSVKSKVQTPVKEETPTNNLPEINKSFDLEDF